MRNERHNPVERQGNVDCDARLITTLIEGLQAIHISLLIKIIYKKNYIINRINHRVNRGIIIVLINEIVRMSVLRMFDGI